MSETNNHQKRFRFTVSIMIAKGELQLFGYLVRVNSFLPCTPIEWDSTNFHLYHTSYKPKLILNKIIRFISFLYFAFSTIQLYPAYQGYGTTYPKHYIIFHAILAILSAWSAMFNTVFMIHGPEIVEAFNQMVSFNRESSNSQKVNKIGSI